MIYWVLLFAVMYTIAVYLDKRVINTGITKKEMKKKKWNLFKRAK